jgi:LCP family protein required for cell wall assembly
MIDSAKPNSINLIEPNNSPTPEMPPKKPGRRFFKLLVYLFIFSLTASAVFTSQIIVSKQSSTSWLDMIPGIKQIKSLAESANQQLKGEDRDRINILLLGMGGKNHDGAYLTDTIILASLEPSTKKVALISIPRDLAVPLDNMGWRKINNVNAFAEAETPGSGGLATSQAVSKVLNQPIDYYIRLDFDGFINIVNELGGLKIEVENTLDDYSYPIMGQEDAYPYESRFEHLYIEKGLQKMDGELALKYARSRHAAGVEGSDFARARRQQKIIEAVKNKVLDMTVFFKPTMVANILGQLNEHVSTNLKVWEIVRLWNDFKSIEKENIITKVIDNGPNGLVTDSITAEGAYILSPRSGDFAEIQYFVNTIFTAPPEDVKTQVQSERATLEVRNGTWVNGLASKTALDLEKLGFNVVRLGNNSGQQFQKSVIYDLSYGAKPKSLAVLKQKTNANVAYALPDWLVNEIENDLADEKNPVQPDFLLVLGQDADKSQSGSVNPKD